MGEILLKELSHRDLTWIFESGRRQELAAGTVLMEEGQAIDRFHILLDGTLSATISCDRQDPLSKAYTAIEGSARSALEIGQLSSGEVVGEISLIRMCFATTTVTAVEKSSIVSVPLMSLEHKLAQDAGFAARFYRAIAILLKNRLYNFIEKNHRKSRATQSVKDVLLLFARLNDSDLDWIVASGEVQKIAANTVVIQENGPVDALYILLSGSISLSKMDGDRNPLTRIFAALETAEVTGIEISRLSKGEIMGENQFVASELPYFTAKTLEDSKLLALPRQKLTVKLQQDLGFAARFYQTLAILFSDRLQAMLNQQGYSRRIYHSGNSLANDVEYDLELDSDSLEQISLAGQKFTWMLKRLENSISST